MMYHINSKSKTTSKLQCACIIKRQAMGWDGESFFWWQAHQACSNQGGHRPLLPSSLLAIVFVGVILIVGPQSNVCAFKKTSTKQKKKFSSPENKCLMQHLCKHKFGIEGKFVLQKHVPPILAYVKSILSPPVPDNVPLMYLPNRVTLGTFRPVQGHQFFAPSRGMIFACIT